MIKELCTANYAGGYTFTLCGNANRTARGCGTGIYPITPQTEVVETVVKLFQELKIEKGRIFAVESEHSALAACIGMSIEGARTFTATSSNGALYMAENIVSASLFRLPIVMQIVNRTLGPEWNIWAEQGESLMFRDWGWIQIYCENNQELVDHILMGFYMSEHPKVLLPSMLNVDAFILSHNLMPTLLPTQEEADEYLPLLELPHRLTFEKPFTIGGLALPRVTAWHRYDMERDIYNVFTVYKEAQDRFEKIFNRRPEDPVTGHFIEDAEVIFITSSTICSTTKTIIEQYRKKGHKIGMIKIKLFRPFPSEQLLHSIENVPKIGIIDRNFALGAPNKIGGIFAQDIISVLQFSKKKPLVQSYIAGIGGMDVTPTIIEEIVEDLIQREHSEPSLWKGL